MSVKKVFITLIIVAVCVIVGGYILSTLAPGVVNGVKSAVQEQIQNTTGINVNFGGNMTGGKVH